MGLSDIKNSNSNKNKKKNKEWNVYATPHHFSQTHTQPKSGKQVKTDENSTGRLWYTLRERPRQRHDTARQSRKTSSRTSTHTSPSCFHFTYILAYTGCKEHGTIKPVWRSLRTQYQFTTSYLIKLHILHIPPSTSYVRINFASIIRCQINVLHTSCLWVAAVSLCHTICKATSNVNYTSYWFVSSHLHAST